MSLKFCPKCGNKLEPDSRFCDTCGVDLTSRAEVSEVSPPVKTEVLQKQSIQTVEKIAPEGVVYGDFWPRFGAIFIDWIIIGIASWMISFLIFLPYFIYHPFRVGEWWFTFPFDWLIGFLYFWLMETYNNGQTLGKVALNLRTVDEKTLEPTSPGSYAINNLLKGGGLLIIDFLIGIIKNSGEPEKRLRIMQNASETVVISTK
ncbi:MAG: RDD family protein [Candidatus Hodarchaeota archaeon]